MLDEVRDKGHILILTALDLSKFPVYQTLRMRESEYVNQYIPT